MLTSCALSIEFHIISVLVLVIIQVLYFHYILQISSYVYDSCFIYQYHFISFYMFHLSISLYLFLHVSCPHIPKKWIHERTKCTRGYYHCTCDAPKTGCLVDHRQPAEIYVSHVIRPIHPYSPQCIFYTKLI